MTAVQKRIYWSKSGFCLANEFEDDIIILESEHKPKLTNSINFVYFSFVEEFPHAWALLLDHIEGAALCQNAEISIAAIKSFQEMLLISKDDSSTFTMQPLPVKPPISESINRTGDPPAADATSKSQNETETDQTGSVSEYDIALWSAAWKVWLNIGTHATKPPEDSTSLYVPSQPFLTALIQTFPPLLDHIKVRFSVTDLKKLSDVLKKALTVPVHGDSSPFIIPTFPDVSTTPLQEATLQAVEALIKVKHLFCKVLF